MDVLVLAGALIFKLIEFAKHARARNWSAVITQAIVWTVGIAVILLLAETTVAAGRQILGVELGRAPFADLVFIGLMASSLIPGLGDKLFKALDNTQTSATPSLVTGEMPELITTVTTSTVDADDPPLEPDTLAASSPSARRSRRRRG